MDSFLVWHPAAPGSILGVPAGLFVTEINYLHVPEIH